MNGRLDPPEFRGDCLLRLANAPGQSHGHHRGRYRCPGNRWPAPEPRTHQGLHEDLDIRNYGGKHLHFILELLLRSDFADLFEVKAKQFTRRGEIERDWTAAAMPATRYANGDLPGALPAAGLRERGPCTPTAASVLISSRRRAGPGMPAANVTSWPTSKCSPPQRSAGKLMSGCHLPRPWRSGRKAPRKSRRPTRNSTGFYHQSVEDMAALAADR